MFEGLDGSGDEVLLAEHGVPCEGRLEVVDRPCGGVHIVLDRVRQGRLLLLTLRSVARSRTCEISETVEV